MASSTLGLSKKAWLSEDWGGASFAPLCQTLASSYLGAEPSFLKEHEVKLLKFFAEEYQEVTGVKLDRQQLLQNFKLAQASGIAGCCANIQWCLRPGPWILWALDMSSPDLS